MFGFATVSLAQSADQATQPQVEQVTPSAEVDGDAETVGKGHCGDKAKAKSCCASKGTAQAKAGCGSAEVKKSCCAKGGHAQAAVKEEEK